MVAITNNVFVIAAALIAAVNAAPDRPTGGAPQFANAAQGVRDPYAAYAYANAHRADGTVDGAAYENTGDFVGRLNDYTNLLLANRDDTATGQIYYRLNQLDHVTDDTVNAIGNMLAPVTGGASKAVANFLLGPAVQSITHGILATEATIAGGASDRATGRAQNIANSARQLQQMAARAGTDVNTQQLVASADKLQQTINQNRQKSHAKRETLSVDDFMHKLSEVSNYAKNSDSYSAAQAFICPFMEEITPEVSAVESAVDSSKAKEITDNVNSLLETADKAGASCQAAAALKVNIESLAAM